MVRSILSRFFDGSTIFFDFFRFSTCSVDGASVVCLGGLRMANAKFFELFATEPDLEVVEFFVISANFSKVELSRDKNEPRGLLVWKIKKKYHLHKHIDKLYSVKLKKNCENLSNIVSKLAHFEK